MNELRIDEKLLLQAVDAVGEGVVIADESGHLVFFNRVADELTGVGLTRTQPDEWQRTYGVFHADMTTPFEASEIALSRALRGECVDRQIQYVQNRKRQKGLFLSVSARPIRDDQGKLKGAVCSFADVSREIDLEKQGKQYLENLEARVQEELRLRMDTEEKLLQSQKMEAVGRLAGGVAHDFNNKLSVIMMNASLAIQEVVEESKARKQLQNIMLAAERSSSLTHQLLAFSRKQLLRMQVVDLNQLVKGCQKLFDFVLGAHVESSFSPGDALGSVRIDPTQMDQVIMNLAINARDAMPEGGKLILETSNVTLDESYCSQHPEVSPGQYVLLSVTDTGEGMSKEILSKIFEPFFTTKEKGKGTGLGLSTSFGIVKQSGGHIWAYSEVGLGTTFKVYLPRVDQEVEEVLKKPSSISPSLPKMKILVAEDEPLVREALGNILKQQGHEVWLACDGDEALRIFDRHSRELQLLLVDIVMPGRGGRKLADSILEKSPKIKVIYMSGYSENSVSQQGWLEPGTILIQKPIRSEDLLQTLEFVCS